jgi:DNA polymerase elongation subunit (family B)
VKCRFYLLDVSEHECEGKPGVRLWGIDESGGRVLIECNLIMPYFYYLPGETEDVDRVKEEVTRNKKAFPEVLNVTTETKKLLGHERQVLKITCMESDVRSGYASELRKNIRKGAELRTRPEALRPIHHGSHADNQRMERMRCRTN